MKTCDLIVKCLENEGVEYIFGIPGEETLEYHGCLKPVEDHLCPHQARAVGRLHGRCLWPPHRQGRGVPLHPGPRRHQPADGHSQDAILDRAPLLAITGQAELGRIHKESHQYVDIVKNFATVTKWKIEDQDTRCRGGGGEEGLQDSRDGEARLGSPGASRGCGGRKGEPDLSDPVIPPIRARRFFRGQALPETGSGAVGTILTSGYPHGQRRGAQERRLRSSGSSPNSSAFPW